MLLPLFSNGTLTGAEYRDIVHIHVLFRNRARA